MKKAIYGVLFFLMGAGLAFGQGATCQYGFSCGANETTNGDAVILFTPQDTATIVVNVSGTWTGTISFKGSNGDSYVANTCTSQSAGTTATTTTGNGQWRCPVAGLTSFEAISTASMTGTAVVTVTASRGSPSMGNGNGSGVTSVVIAGTANQIGAAGTCTITSTGTCTLSLTNPVVFPGNISGPAGWTVGSADTGSPTITFGTNSVSINQPLSNTNSVLITPNLGTPSALNCANCTNVPATALPTPTSTAVGGTLANTSFQTVVAVTSLTTTFTQNQIRIFAIYIPTPQVWSNLIYAVGVADNSANSYDIGMYGPGCLAGATNVPLAIHAGTTAGTTLTPSTGLKTIAASASNVAISQGWYCVGITSSGASPTAVLGGQTTGVATPWSPSNISGGGATLPSTITAPATSWVTTQGMVNFGGYK